MASLRSPDVDFSDDDRRELLATAEESLDRLARLVENLLDMSRLQAGALAMSPQLISVGEAIPRAVDDIAGAAATCGSRFPTTCPRCSPTRPCSNASWSTCSPTPCATARPSSRPRHRQRARRTGRGARRRPRPRHPADDWERVFLPFQRLGDRDNATGVGLGLALSRGLAEAMGGTLTPEHTPAAG